MTSCSSPSTKDGDELSFGPAAPDFDINRNTAKNGCHNSDQSSVADPKSRPSSAENRHPSSFDWLRVHVHNGHTSTVLAQASLTVPPATMSFGKIAPSSASPRPRQNSWAASPLVLFIATLGMAILFAILRSRLRHEVEPKGCRMSYMRPSYVHFSGFDTEHTRFASKYSLYLYREQGTDDQDKVGAPLFFLHVGHEDYWTPTVDVNAQLHGIPILFIPGNAGSYKQVRPIAAEAANYFYTSLLYDGVSVESGVRNLDFFTVDFNEDITAFHGQTLLDQAEYLNEAIRYILSLYSDPQRADRDSQIPEPSAVLVLGHSMGGIVARAMLIQPNYQPKSINTIITMSAPHARPPVTFDARIVHIYDEINNYWRNAYAQKWANDNPLWHVTLVSIAGGGLDTVVPSDYASLESIVPETHGFTVFTTGIPTVWTSMDHQAILWCDQFRKVVARALYDIVDAKRASQTKPRADRMRLLKRRLLPGMESTAEKMIMFRKATTLLTLGDDSGHIVPAGARLSLGSLGANSKPTAYLLPIPPTGSPGVKRFTLITDASLNDGRTNGRLEVLLCNVFPLQPGSAEFLFSTHIDLSDVSGLSTRLACKNTAFDSIFLPATTSSTPHPLYSDPEQGIRPYTYLQYGPEHLAEHQFIAVVDTASSSPHGFVLAEFSDLEDGRRKYDTSLAELLTLGLSFKLPADRPIVVDVSISSATSALLAFDLEVSQSWCHKGEKFALLMRQYLDKPYESKYFVNAKQVSVSFHGTAPFVPPSLESPEHAGLALQFWSDPVCDMPLEVRLKLDAWGSLGKLYMRYRTALAAFPLLVVTMVLRKQFRIYDETGIFLSFSESLDLSLRRSIPLLLLFLTLISSSIGASSIFKPFWNRWSASHESSGGFHRNELLIGTEDFLFCFLIPLIGIVCVGVCATLHYVMLGFTRTLGLLLGLVNGPQLGGVGADVQHQAISTVFVSATPRRRMVSTAVLLFLVSTFIPYQFAFLVACLVQIFTVVRAFRISTIAASTSNHSYYHYVHSVLLLMMWVLPINLPILAVWVRNLAVHWLTPFSSHHNVLSIMPFILLVENLTAGRMVPQITSWLRHVTNVLLFGTALCAAVYGVSHAYALHYLVNAVAAWLIVLHSTSNAWSSSTLCAMFGGNASDARKRGKTP